MNIVTNNAFLKYMILDNKTKYLFLYHDIGSIINMLYLKGLFVQKGNYTQPLPIKIAKA